VVTLGHGGDTPCPPIETFSLFMNASAGLAPLAVICKQKIKHKIIPKNFSIVADVVLMCQILYEGPSKNLYNCIKVEILDQIGGL